MINFEKISKDRYKVRLTGIGNVYKFIEDKYKAIYDHNIDEFTTAMNNVLIDDMLDRFIMGEFIKQHKDELTSKDSQDFVNVVIPSDIMSPSVTITIAYNKIEDKGFTYNRRDTN